MDRFILGGDLTPKNCKPVVGKLTFIQPHFSYDFQSTTGLTHQDYSDINHEAELPSHYMKFAQEADQADISRFLSRKVLISSTDWDVGSRPTLELDPWTLYLSEPSVSNKLQNYALLKANMKITVQINATPFHSSLLLASYRYFLTANETSPGVSDLAMVTRSQRPHIWVNASTCKGGCICIPMLIPEEMLSLGGKGVTDISFIGRFHLDSATAVRQLNGGTDNIHISIFAELTDVKLTAPTTTAVVYQATKSDADFSYFFQGDEYEAKGPISKVASAVADMAGSLSVIPAIAPFALATNIGANAIGGIASLFGYGRPVVISDTAYMKNTPVSSLALTDSKDTVQKLSVTSKQELTIDPNTVGISSVDNLALDFWTRKESYVDHFDWDVSDPEGEAIVFAHVTPMWERVTGDTHVPTSLSYASRLFDQWSGSLKYRFQIECSQYHRGKIAFLYDPVSPSASSSSFNTTFNRIIDISETRDFTMVVPWQYPLAYARLDVPNSYTFSSDDLPVGADEFSNGSWWLQVVNPLCSPDGVTGVTIFVSISAGDDFELVNPSGKGAHVAMKPQGSPSIVDFDYWFQSAPAVELVPTTENAPEAEENVETLLDHRPNRDEKALRYYGERVTSFRQLLKRYGHFRTFGQGEGTAIASLISTRFWAMPFLGGYDTSGVDTTLTARSYNYMGPTYISYFKGAFGGWRGSIRWKFLNNGNNAYQGAVIRNSTHDERVDTTNFLLPTEVIVPTAGKSAYASFGDRAHDLCTGGAALTQQRTMDSLEVEVPYALPFNFSRSVNNMGANSRSNAYPWGDSLKVVTSIGNGDASLRMNAFVAAGEDFMFVGFIGAPTFYVYDDPPPALLN